MLRGVLYISVLYLISALLVGCTKASETSSKEPEITKEGMVSANPYTKAEATPAVTEAAGIAEAAGITEAADITEAAVSFAYKDGVYEVETPLDAEKYYTKATVTIEGGKITSADWTIYDSARKDTPFDDQYYKIMAEYDDLYAQQSKDDWSGSRGYSDTLITSQDIDQVDAVSGATWTNKKFKEAVKLALDEAAAE